MFDAVNLAKLPAGQLEAGYVGGHYLTFPKLRAKFPTTELVSIAISADERAQVYDVERGDLSPAQLLDCVRRDRADNLWPSGYWNTSTGPDVQAIFHSAAVQLPPWWRADYNGHPALEMGEVAHQYASHPGYDVSVVADYWPGIDPPQQPPGDEMPYLAQGPTAGIWIVDAGKATHIPDMPDVTAYLAAGYKLIPLTDALIAALGA